MYRRTAHAKTFLVADSPAMKQVVSRVGAYADGDVPVLICGEHGTGRELIARVLHQAGPRRHARFVAVRPAQPSKAVRAARTASRRSFREARGTFTPATGR